MYYTEGKNLYLGRIFNVFYTADNVFDNPTDRYRIILIENGTLIIKINNEKKTIITPSLIILNEKDKIEVLEQNTKTFHCLYFLPKVLNNELSLENLNDPVIRGNFTDTIKQDYHFFKVFLKNNTDEKILNLISWDIVKKIKSLLTDIKNELETQKDNWWTCNSRCFLIQMLFIIHQLTSYKSSLPAINIENTGNVVDKILIYLNSNYDKKITIKDLTKMFNTNRTTINQIFKKETGKTIFKYLIDLSKLILPQLKQEDTSTKFVEQPLFYGIDLNIIDE